MLTVNSLYFDYQDCPVLHDVHLHVPAGGLLHLQGGNGAGKTTLLQLIAGLYSPTQGEIQFNAKPLDEDRLSYQQQLCFVGHQAGVHPFLSVKENCYFDMHCQLFAQDLAQLASVFNLEHHTNTLCAFLSAGQRRQVALLRLWMTNAVLWLLDEPLVALDATSVAVLMDKIALHRSLGGMVILTSHQPLPLPDALYQRYCL